MTSAAQTHTQTADGRSLKNPLAAAAAPSSPATQAPHLQAMQHAALTPRQEVIAEFADYLATTTSRRTKRPHEYSTINSYEQPAKNLDEWMTARGINGDFTGADTTTLNRYFRDYYDQHSQGGTHTLQRNLLQLFNFLRDEHGWPSPYTDKLNRYSQVGGRPRTLSDQFIDDLLEATAASFGVVYEMTASRSIPLNRNCVYWQSSPISIIPVPR